MFIHNIFHSRLISDTACITVIVHSSVHTVILIYLCYTHIVILKYNMLLILYMYIFILLIVTAGYYIGPCSMVIDRAWTILVYGYQ